MASRVGFRRKTPQSSPPIFVADSGPMLNAQLPPTRMGAFLSPCAFHRWFRFKRFHFQSLWRGWLNASRAFAPLLGMLSLPSCQALNLRRPSGSRTAPKTRKGGTRPSRLNSRHRPSRLYRSWLRPFPLSTSWPTIPATALSEPCPPECPRCLAHHFICWTKRLYGYSG